MVDENLKTALLNNNVILFVGAGCSMPLNYPSWKNLVSEILDHFIQEDSDSATLDFTKLKNQLEQNVKTPLDILILLESDTSYGNNYKATAKEKVYNLFSNIKSENNFTSETHKLMWNVSNKIITTNYDRILENNILNSSEIKVFGNDNEFMALKSQNDDSQFLYKIHGDFENPDKIILFESDYKMIYNGGSNTDTLSTFFKSKTFLFIGFSLSDPFINELFSHIKTIYKDFTVGNHFIFSTNNSEDYSNYDVKKIYIENWEDQLLNYLRELASLKKSETMSSVELQKINDNSIEEDESIDSLFIIIKNKTDELKKSPSNKMLAAELHDLKSKINELMYGDLDYLKSFNKEYKNTHLEMLFETIYGVENLNTETVAEINRIRTDYENHSWFERAQLVSAIACSLFIFNKADEKKISLLVDFISDNEEKVWERSLTYLVIILNHLGNKWLRYESIKRKVQSLTLNNKVQNACQKIVEYIIVFGIEKFNLSAKIFDNPYFKDSPYNYFLPFFKENNPLFENVYDNYKGDNIDEFINQLEKCPVPDSVKYVWCNTESDKKDEVDEKRDRKEENYFLYHLDINSGYFPFAGYIQQFVSFINGFPHFNHKKLIDEQLKITATPLKDYLLNEQEKYRVLGIHFFKEKNWGQAIINIEKYLTFVQDDIMILDNLAKCYLNHDENEKAKKISIRLMNNNPSYAQNTMRLSEIYLAENDFIKALEVIESFPIDNKNASILYQKAVCLNELNRGNDALISLDELEKLGHDDEASVCNLYGVIYEKLERFDDALSAFNKAIDLQVKPLYLSNRSTLYEKLENYEKALVDVENAIKIDSDDNLLFKKTYILVYLNRFEDALKILRCIKKQGAEYFNTLANLYRIKGDFENAFSTIKKAISSSDDKRYLGTKAAIFATMGDDENFYSVLEEVLSCGVKAENFLPDIKKKYQKEKQFIKILKKYNQVI